MQLCCSFSRIPLRKLWECQGVEFGARQKDPRYFNENGYMDFDLFVRSEAFQEGFKKVTAGMELGYTFALMCAEKLPVFCHRAIMVGRYFSEHGYDVIHLRLDDTPITHHDLEEHLLVCSSQDYASGQCSIFDDERKVLLQKAYKDYNFSIAYRMPEVRNTSKINNEAEGQYWNRFQTDCS